MGFLDREGQQVLTCRARARSATSAKDVALTSFSWNASGSLSRTCTESLSNTRASQAGHSHCI